ncbi:37S ribosomal protein S9, mitochondrial [Lambiella insularis]|nr:37S ribosomal protein S9, mitochondrial [Lambiella insularis]
MASKLPISVMRLTSRYISCYRPTHPPHLPHHHFPRSLPSRLFSIAPTRYAASIDESDFTEDNLAPAIQEMIAEDAQESEEYEDIQSTVDEAATQASEYDIDEDPDDIASASGDYPRIVPASPSYFTGKPQYTDDLLSLQELLRKYQTLPTVPPAQAPRVAWQTLPQYRIMVEEEVAASKFHKIVEVLQRLNRIHPALMPEEVVTSMQHYRRNVDPFAVRRRPQIVDADGRSFGNGRRKSSTANVYLVEGEGEVLINGKSITQVFPRIHDRESALWALKSTGRIDKYNVWAMVHGGGSTGQAESITLAVAKALMVHEPALKPALRRGRVELVPFVFVKWLDG